MRKNICFLHTYGINNYKNILEEYVSLGYDFFNICDRVFVPYGAEKPPQLHDKFEITSISPPDELTTMDIIHSYCKSNIDANICYIHTKGVTNDNECVTDWRRYMFYFCCQKYRDRIEDMKSHDTCGVDLRSNPCPHYSGNFWWARSDYISKLPTPRQTYSPLSERHKAEFWIGSNPNGKHLSIHDCGINVFERHLHRYPPEKYSI